MDGTNFKDFKMQLLKKSNVRDKYEALQPKYAIIETIIARRTQLSISQRKLARLTGMQQPQYADLKEAITIYSGNSS